MVSKPFFNTNTTQLQGYFSRKEGELGGLKKRWVVLKPTEVIFMDKPKAKQPLDTMSILDISKCASKGKNLLFLLKGGKKRTLVGPSAALSQKWCGKVKMLLAATKELKKKAIKEIKKNRPKTFMDGKQPVKSTISITKRVEKDLFLDYCARGNIDELKKLKSKANVVDELGNSPLHLAAAGNHLPVLRYLIEKKKLKINSLNNNKDTCLHVAAWKNAFECVQYLLLKGIDYAKFNKDGKQAVDLASKLKVKSLLESVFPEDDEDDGEDIDEDA